MDSGRYFHWPGRWNAGPTTRATGSARFLGPQRHIVQHLRALPHCEVASAVETVGESFGTAGAQTGVRVPDSDGGEVTPATRSRTGTTSRSAGSLNEGRGRDPRRHVTKSGSVASFEKRSTKAGVETPATPRRQVARLARRLRSTKAGVETPATLLIGAKNLHGRNSAPDLAAHGRDVDHLFGPCLGVDVVAGPEMPSKSWTSHNLEPAGG